MSSHLHAQKSTKKTKANNRLLMMMLSIILGTGVVLTGCDKADDNNTEAQKVQILDDEVIVDNSLVLTSNPERYQPSYNLKGSLIPVNLSEIKTPYSADNITLYVNKGDLVEKNQVLATIDTTISENVAAYIDHSFIDVLIDGVPHTIQQAEPLANSDKPTADEAEPNTNNTQDEPEANTPNKTSDNISKDATVTESKAVENVADSTKKIEVTLVFRSPVKGTVMRLNEDIQAALEAKYPKQASSEQNMNTPSDNSAQADKKTQVSNRKTEDNDGVVKADIANQDNQQDTSKQASKQGSKQGSSNKTEPKELDYNITQGQMLLTVGDTSQLQLIGKLPLSTKSQLSVGRPVNFTVFDVNTEFTGQISHITPAADGKNLIVRAPLIAGGRSPATLEPGMRAAMSIDYGQIELGVRLPASGIFEADLSKLNAKQPRPTNPVKGYVWVIEQDQRLSYTPIEVVQYFADSDKYLVHGISNDSLVCLADLPKDSDGKIISVD